MSRFVFVVCCAAMMVLSISVNLMPVCLPLLSVGFGHGPLDKEQLGRIAAVTFIGILSGLLLGGPLANRHPPRWFTVGGCLLVAAGLGILGCAHTYDQILLAVAVMGFGGGVLDMILSPLICAIWPDQRSVALNWLHSFYCVGAVLTVLTATVTLARDVDWKTLALWSMLPGLAVGIVFLFLPHPPLHAEPEQRTRVRSLLHEKFFLLTLATIFFGGATEAAMAQWLPSFAELDLGFSRVVGGTSLLLFSVAMALGRMVVGLLNNRFSILQVMAWGCALTTVLFLLAGFFPVPAVQLAAAVVAGFTGSCLWPSTLGVAADRYPAGGGSMFGVLAAFGNFGCVFMPWGIGLIADKSSLALGLGCSALCPLLMLITLYFLRREKRGLVPDPLKPVFSP
jgi:fucose permease